jgi:hypothetical protein
MERTTQRWVIIFGAVLALYVVMMVSHTLLGVKILPW